MYCCNTYLSSFLNWMGDARTLRWPVLYTVTLPTCVYTTLHTCRRGNKSEMIFSTGEINTRGNKDGKTTFVRSFFSLCTITIPLLSTYRSEP